ncbi:MAG TPA: SigB/SigF/SigG family RNA polymerase sigma factor [Thermoleophilaceae bacterium]|jgi:RNA polymerase sigma-B factor
MATSVAVAFEAEAQDELIERYSPLARRLASRYRYTSEPYEDLVQVAMVGLVLAARRWDPGRGPSFPSYAVPTIMGELRRHIRDHGWVARVPRSLQENVLRVRAAHDDLCTALGRSPTPRELAAAVGLTTEDVLEAMEAASAFDADSLDRPLDGDEGGGETLIAGIGGHEPGYDVVEHGAAIGPAMAHLSSRERAIVAMRFFEDLTQSEIAARLGVSQMQVSRLLRRALDRLHEEVREEAPAEEPVPTM